jgi:prephenate dehydratase
MKAVAYQGAQGAFSEMAIECYFGDKVKAIGKNSFAEVFNSLAQHTVDLIALPIENSLIGPIFENFDLLTSYPFTVIGELCLPIEHCLIAKKGQEIENIKKVYSHPKALAQCQAFFQNHPWMEPIAHFDTAGAAQDIALSQDPTIAAVASRKTADLYSLEILRVHLEDEPNNTTRFWFLSHAKTQGEVKKTGKCSLLFNIRHQPGSLAQVLQFLAQQGLNLTQIVSRPIREQPFHYRFFVDVLYSCDAQLFDALQGLQEITQELKLLGIYEPA